MAGHPRTGSDLPRPKVYLPARQGGRTGAAPSQCARCPSRWRRMQPQHQWRTRSRGLGPPLRGAQGKRRHRWCAQAPSRARRRGSRGPPSTCLPGPLATSFRTTGARWAGGSPRLHIRRGLWTQRPSANCTPRFLSSATSRRRFKRAPRVEWSTTRCARASAHARTPARTRVVHSRGRPGLQDEVLLHERCHQVTDTRARSKLSQLKRMLRPGLGTKETKL
mmetsp:Transcript_17426/g.43867  ORF Transcript_17426/g.43867 Transcript_17426/m.43867 type:complete len:221 (-) Transcript_17426:924-1586(-)